MDFLLARRRSGNNYAELSALSNFGGNINRSAVFFNYFI